jgi:GTP cyclohydrolase I
MAYKRQDSFDLDVTNNLSDSYKNVIGLLGEDSEREGLQKTPERIAKAMQYLTQGYQMDAKAILESAMFHEDVSLIHISEPTRLM